MAKQAAKKKDPAEQPEKTTEATAEKAEEPTLEVVKRPNPIGANRLSLEVEANTVRRVTVPNDVEPDQCLDEAFWCHVSMHFAPGDTLVVRPDDTSWELILHVINAGPQFAHVSKKHFYELTKMDDVPRRPSLYKVEYAGPIHKWRFLREGKMMRDGFATEALARRAAAQHEMAVNRKPTK